MAATPQHIPLEQVYALIDSKQYGTVQSIDHGLGILEAILRDLDRNGAGRAITESLGSVVRQMRAYAEEFDKQKAEAEEQISTENARISSLENKVRELQYDLEAAEERCDELRHDLKCLRREQGVA
jgi:chromosome segregation ATPase